MARVVEIFAGADGDVISASSKTAVGVFRRPAMKLAPVLYEYFRDGNRVGDVGTQDFETNIIQKSWHVKFNVK